MVSRKVQKTDALESLFMDVVRKAGEYNENEKNSVKSTLVLALVLVGAVSELQKN